MGPTRAILAASLLAIHVIVSVAGAQTSGLTPEQERLLNQLPASQRQQALDALRQMQDERVQTVGQPVTEFDDVVVEQDAGDAIATLFVPPRAGPNSQLVISLVPTASLSSAEIQRLENDPAQRRLRGNHSFELDDNGVLSLLDLVSIPLLGLTEDDIVRRLGTEPLLAPFDIEVRLLDLLPIGVEALEPFGYEIFESDLTSFDPTMTGPVPPDYVLGPGDMVRVQLFGNVNGIYEFDVTRDGILNLPEIGPVTVAGLPFSEFRADVNRRVQEMLIGTQVSVTMGQLRNIRVFVLGDANRPGSYVVSSLATISSALYRSGGISRIGSLRDIQLKRGGQLVARLDLYELLLNGDTSGDRRLQPGDVIFVAPVGDQVGIAGAVKRPAIYETRGEATIGDVVSMAGGFTSDAYPDGAWIERINAGQERVVIALDADDAEAARANIETGDVLTVPTVLPELRYTVTLAGFVHRPGPYQWRAGMKLTDLIGSALDLRPGGDAGYVLIRREDPNDRSVSVVSANLHAALAAPSSGANLGLQPRDTVYVFSLAFGRQRVIAPILEELQLQSRAGEPYREVSISGQVKAPGVYPLEDGMRVSDLIRAGGGLDEQAYTLGAEIARYEIVNGEDRQVAVIDVDLGALLRGDPSADVVLGEHDNLRISRIPDWDTLSSVTLEGEVMFPGEYRIRQGETLGQLLQRAGGLTDEAFANGAIFLRESLRLREQQQIDELARRLEADLTSLALDQTSTSNANSVETGRSLLAQLRDTEAVGRLVIDLERIVRGGAQDQTNSDVELRNGDRLLVPMRSQSVTVIGESQQNTSHLYKPGLDRDDYINLSGGLTRHADKRLIYVVRANGAVVAGNRSRWFGRSSGSEIQPGDTIVVPLDTQPIRPLTLWASVTQILYQAAIAVAAVNSFGD